MLNLRRSKSNGISSTLWKPATSSCPCCKTAGSIGLAFTAWMMAWSSGFLMPVSKLLFRNASATTRLAGAPNASTSRSSVISPLVSVPVLSLHNTSMLPKF